MKKIPEKRMKNLLRLFAFKSRAHDLPCLSPPPCPPCASVLSLRNPDTSGLTKRSPRNLPFCAFTVPTCPEPIRGNPKLRAETCPSCLTGLVKPNRNTLNDVGFPGGCTYLHQVAPTCGLKIFS